MKARCFFPQTVTPEYDAIKKVEQCKDVSLPAVRHVDQMKTSIHFYIACHRVIVFVCFISFFIESLSATSRHSKVYASNRLACPSASSYQRQTAE